MNTEPNNVKVLYRLGATDFLKLFRRLPGAFFTQPPALRERGWGLVLKAVERGVSHPEKLAAIGQASVLGREPGKRCEVVHV